MNEAVGEPRSAQRVAVFTKPRGGDYVWTERGSIPDIFAELAPWLAQFDTPINIVLTGAANWFLRCTAASISGDGRLVMCSEVYRLNEVGPLRASEALALVADSSILEESSGRWRFDIRAASASDAALVLPDERIAARLALPLSVALDVARNLVELPAWRFSGICYAHDDGVAWSEKLRGFLAVNLRKPRLTEEEQQLLHAGVALQDERRWAILDRLTAEQARLVIRGGADAIRAPELLAERLEWTALNDTGPTALADAIAQLYIPPQSLTPLLALFQRELGTTAAAALMAIIQNERAEFDGSTLDVLCERGFLQWLGDDFVPAWAGGATESTCAAALLERRLANDAFDPELVRWLVRGSITDGEQPRAQMAALLERLVQLRVPPHPRAFATWVAAIDNQDRPLLQHIERSFGESPASALSHYVLTGESPVNVLDEAQLAAGLIARHRLFGEDATFDCILGLRDGRGIAVAADILERCLDFAAETSSLRSIARAVMASLRGEPLDTDLPADLVRRLAARELLSAGSIPVVTRSDLVRAAQLFRGLSTLSSLLAQPPQWTGRPEIPAQWMSICRDVLSMPVLERAAMSVGRDDHDAFLDFVAAIHDLDPAIMAFLRGTARKVTSEMLAALRLWMPLLSPLFDLDDRVHAIVSLVRAGKRLAEDVAVDIVELLFSSASPESKDLLIYALTGVGPFPLLRGVSPGLLTPLISFVNIAEIIDGLFNGSDAAGDPAVLRAVVEQVRITGAGYPAHGYTALQKQRSERLVMALSQCDGWEALAGSSDERRRQALRLLESLGIEPGDLLDASEKHDDLA